MQVILSILICTIEKRKSLYNQLEIEINKQINENGLHGYVEIIPKSDKGYDQGGMNIGAKRNWLYNKATGLWSVSVDDDDWIEGEYIKLLINALESDPDCVNMIGVMNTDGFNQRRFEHSIKHHHYFERDKIYYRHPDTLILSVQVLPSVLNFQRLILARTQTGQCS